MKIGCNRHILFVEIFEDEIGEYMKLEISGEMLIGGFWIFEFEEIKQILPEEKILSKEEKEKIIKFILEHNDHSKFNIVL